MKILDCTLRDGGYYTDWDFDDEIVSKYCLTMESIDDIDYVEIGYRSIELPGYYGKYFYCPLFLIKDLKAKMPSKKLAIILNEKDIRALHVEALLKPCVNYIDLVRIAVDPSNFERSLYLIEEINKYNFKVALNVMYMSKWEDDQDFINNLGKLTGKIDYFYLVDSFGGISSKEVKEKINLIKSKTDIPLGFHGHNNLEMALGNSLEACEMGCEIIDSTITGIGRGAGNLKTELLLTYINKNNYNFNYEFLSEIVSDFEDLRSKRPWGTNIAYMLSGAYSLPQKDIMGWIGMERYSLNSIISILQNKLEKKLNKSFSKLIFNLPANSVFILGGGQSIRNNLLEALKLYFLKNKQIVIVHTGLKYIEDFNFLENRQYYCLTGHETNDSLEKITNLNFENKSFVLPPSPILSDTAIINKLRNFLYEIDKIHFSNKSKDSTLTTSLQIALELKTSEVIFAGLDGYQINLNKSKIRLTKENQNIINDFLNQSSLNLFSLTKTLYKGLEYKSIYNLV
jgi:4-hydroxy 2-oxovalerate aldolase